MHFRDGCVSLRSLRAFDVNTTGVAIWIQLQTTKHPVPDRV